MKSEETLLQKQLMYNNYSIKGGSIWEHYGYCHSGLGIVEYMHGISVANTV